MAKLQRTRKAPERIPGRRLMSFQQAAERTSLSRFTLEDWARAGKIASHKLGGRRLVSDAEVDRIIAESEQPRVA